MVPAASVSPGLLRYRIFIQQHDGTFIIYPGGIRTNPYAWDHIVKDSWETWVMASETPLELFNVNDDRALLVSYNPDWRNNTTEVVVADRPNQLVLKSTMKKTSSGQFMEWQYFFGDKIRGRLSELPASGNLVIRARADRKMKIKLGLVMKDAQFFQQTLK